MKPPKLIILFLIIVLALPTTALAARNTQVSGPVYIIQYGDTMSLIASRFGLTLDEIATANPQIDINAIAPGDQVIIPGLEGIEGVLTTEQVQFGETLDSLSRKNNINRDFLIMLNHITNPSELYVGIGLILPINENGATHSKPYSIDRGSSPLLTAVSRNTSPYAMLLANNVEHSWQMLPGEVMFDKNEADIGEQFTFSDKVTNFEISSFPIIQGGTAVVKISSDGPLELSGTLVDKPLKFAKLAENEYVALQGVHALLDPGPYPLRLNITDAAGNTQSFEQMVLVASGYYPNDPILVVDSATIDPTKNDSEFDFIVETISGFTEPRHWNGVFSNPSVFPDCFTSGYGNRRLYQGDDGSGIEYRSFHSGLDFCGGEGLAITAPADGVVLVSELMTIRGNATIIDHGWGVYSGIWHQSQSLVVPGQQVKKGEVIGYVGGTGRVTGAHLHWEVWVNGVQVDPMEWLYTEFP